MKTVSLLRHAKSSWKDTSLPDHQRPLNKRGKKAAPRMGGHMVKEGLVPHRVLCSSAVRATSTWELLSRAVGDQMPVEIRDELYETSPDRLLELIRALPEDESSVLLIGHNPTFEDLALALAGDGNAEALDELDRKYPTGALAVLDFSTDRWGEVREGRGFLRAFIRPKAIK